MTALVQLVFSITLIVLYLIGGMVRRYRRQAKHTQHAVEEFRIKLDSVTSIVLLHHPATPEVRRRHLRLITAIGDRDHGQIATGTGDATPWGAVPAAEHEERRDNL
jgi:hypothetical protein